MKKTGLVAILFLALVAAATPTMADGKQGLMIGGSLGASFYNIDNVNGSNVQLDESDFAWKVFLGYRFGLFALEADYRDFGTVQDTTITGSTIGYGTSAFDISAAAMIPIGPFDVIGRVGASGWDANPSGFSSAFERDGTAFMYGIGAAFRLGSIAIRLEIERFEFDPEPVDMASVGVSFTF